MSVADIKEVKKFLADKGTIKVMATLDAEGNPHVVAKGSFQVDEEDRLVYLELLESSATNKNMIRSLWFDKSIAINLISPERKSLQIKGRPVKTLVAGRVFESYYEQVLRRDPENDLAAVYYIEIDKVIDESYPVRNAQEEKTHPLYIHLDRLAKAGEAQ